MVNANRIIKVYEDEPVLQAFKLMRKKRIGGVPVIENGGNKAVGNISLRDIQFLLTAPEIYHDYSQKKIMCIRLEQKCHVLEFVQKNPMPLQNAQGHVICLLLEEAEVTVP
ncbi:hypothetical protein TorRG33x02_174140 [Trema orientale]|uniref:CBS domain-containing protein n=1 Tax=Trema orientale TaxID=63057 RepID=A0A2P5EMR7_TREOI|nr:hypothetical protein TorRG33x02_174140 [Trema orientale]